MDDTEIIDKTSISADQIEGTHSQFQQTQLADRTEQIESLTEEIIPNKWGELKALINLNVYNLIESKIEIGRNKTCGIVVNNPKVSGIHCKIYKHDLDNSIVLLEDRSSNGTFLNSKRLIKSTPVALKSGDIIGLSYPEKSRECVEKFLFCSTHVSSTQFTKIEDSYIVGKELGKGTYGCVRLAVRKDDQLSVAIKIIDKKKFSSTMSPSIINNIMNEINILKKLKHKFITQLYEVVDTDENVFICMELANGGDLLTKLMESGPYKEEKAKRLFYNLMEAIQYIHANNVVHRDIKPENILIDKDDDSIIKLTDFGLSKVIGNEGLQTFCGTLQYIAPEILAKRFNPTKQYNEAVDIWSCGIVLYILLTGHPPFNSNNIEKQILSGHILYTSAWNAFNPLAKVIYTDNIKDLVSKMLMTDPKKRASLEDIMHHPWRNCCIGPNVTEGVAKRKASEKILTPPKRVHK